MSNLRNFLNEAANAKPLMSLNGKKIYDFDNAQKVNRAELAEEKVTGKQVELGDRMVAPDGLTYAASNVKRAAIDPNSFFDNRYRKVVEKAESDEKTEDVVTYEVVTDYRAIREQASGQVYTNNIIVYAIGKGTGKNKLAVKAVKTISAEEFINEFKSRLDVSSMMKIHGLISTLEQSAVPADKLEL